MTQPCEQHPHAPTFDGLCGGCTQYPADMVKPSRPAATEATDSPNPLHALYAAAIRDTPARYPDDIASAVCRVRDQQMEQLTAAFRDCLDSFTPVLDTHGLHTTHHHARALPHEMRKWQNAAETAEQATAGAWKPPPPGDRREELPPAILNLLGGKPYLSTACDTGQQLEQAPPPKPTSGGAIPNVGWYTERLHARCRLNHKFTGQLCVCGCHEQPDPT